MTYEEQDKMYSAKKEINNLPPRDVGGIYKDEICDFNEMERQQKRLIDLIVSPPKFLIDEKEKIRICYPLVFKVVDNECGFGKSTTALHAIIDYYCDSSHRNNKIIWVTERTKDCEENAKKLNELVQIENFAIAITGSVPRVLREEYIRQYQVVFITHERYRRLAKQYNADERDSFKEGHQVSLMKKLICRIL